MVKELNLYNDLRKTQTLLRRLASAAPSCVSSMTFAASSGVVYRSPSGSVHSLESWRNVCFMFFSPILSEIAPQRH